MLSLFQHPTIHSLLMHVLNPQPETGRLEYEAGRRSRETRVQQVATLRRGPTALGTGMNRMEPQPELLPDSTLAIAVIGMSGRFPGASDTGQLWKNLRSGTESITQLTEEQLRAARVDPALFARPSYVRAAGLVQGADLFDATLFGLTPREAELLDPQHRLFMECAYEALEDGAHDPERYDGLIGVYGGVGLNTYYLHNVFPRRDLIEKVGAFRAIV